MRGTPSIVCISFNFNDLVLRVNAQDFAVRTTTAFPMNDQI